MKKKVNELGFRYAIFGLLIIIVSMVASLIIRKYFASFVSPIEADVSLLVSVITIDFIGLGAVFLLTKGLEKNKIEKKKLAFKEFLPYVFMMWFFSYAGAIIGIIPHGILTLLTGTDMNQMVTLMTGSNFFIRVLCAGVIAPIAEELLFRKILIDRMYGKCSEAVIILMSGIMFGLFHGNFQQCFFAGLIGAMFAFIYLRTGNIKYTIGLHMILNLMSSVVSTALVKKYLNLALPILQGNFYDMFTMDMSEFYLWTSILYLWLGILMALAITGLVFFIKFMRAKKFKLKDFHENETEEKTQDKKSAFMILLTSWGFLSFVIVSLIRFIQSYGGLRF